MPGKQPSSFLPSTEVLHLDCGNSTRCASSLCFTSSPLKCRLKKQDISFIKAARQSTGDDAVGAWVLQGGFLPEMTKREASQILGMRESAGEDKIREAHLRIMKANHPDLGGSSYIAEKVNQAKDMLLGKRNRTSHF